ncbi:hypothetical protein B9Z55_006509 [Caenorhabditis nigoni]|uniref:Uncharacterized protein n=1 Tax=Caenorhabditis nigoni TaxID=1611254 RepID=A0A2G5V5G5_9PELO|nr:hypothetical protein B9Z55_006509 [Caenorhabditis nigoni]
MTIVLGQPVYQNFNTVPGAWRKTEYVFGKNKKEIVRIHWLNQEQRMWAKKYWKKKKTLERKRRKRMRKSRRRLAGDGRTDGRTGGQMDTRTDEKRKLKQCKCGELDRRNRCC